MNASTLYSKNISCRNSESVVIKINKTKLNWPDDIERSMNQIIIEGSAYPKQELVEITLFNIGDATILLIDANNQIVSTEYVHTDVPIVVSLEANKTSKTFYIVIKSDSWYADGIVCF